MRRPYRILAWVLGLYLAAWGLYVVKSAAGIDLLPDGVHHGPEFPGSDQVVALMRGH